MNTTRTSQFSFLPIEKSFLSFQDLTTISNSTAKNTPKDVLTTLIAYNTTKML